jgi:formate dehydrogenase iron-sulfur subunit
MKFLCDADRWIECNACATACKNEHEVPWGITLSFNDGKPGERSIDGLHALHPPCATGCR